VTIILVTFMKNYTDFPLVSLAKHFPPKIILEHLLQRWYSADAAAVTDKVTTRRSWPWEVQAFLLQVVVKSLLNVLEQNVCLAQPWQHVVLWRDDETVRVFDRLSHYVAPVHVNDAELAAFLRHLSHDVLRAEYWLQVQPSCLTLSQS